MCVSGLVLGVALSVVPDVPLAHYHSIRGIELSPAVCEMPADTVRFIVYHEQAHHDLQHIQRMQGGENQKDLELEADTVAIAKLKNEGVDACQAVQPVLKYRGWYSSSHPNMFTLNNLACKE